MDTIVLLGKSMGITDLLRDYTGPSPNGEEYVKSDLVWNTTCMIQNPQWVSNIHWISAALEYEASDLSGGPEKSPYIIYWEFFDTK